MSNWKTILKRSALALVAVAVAMTWTQTGHGAPALGAPCVVGRGQDPLDVLKLGVKHNVFIGLDNSGTMSSSFLGTPAQGPEPYGPDKRDTNLNDDCDTGTAGNQPGDCSARLRLSKDVLTSVINDLTDASGQPLVNWGFFYTASQNDGVGNLGAMSCAIPQKDNDANFVLDSECEGLDVDQTVPSECGSSDSKDIILDKLRPWSEVGTNGIKNNGGTANAISLNQIAGIIKQNYMGANQKPGQRNFIIYITDGFEDCSCQKKDGSGNPLPISFPAGTAGVPYGSVPFLASNKPALRNDDLAPFDPTQNMPVGTNSSLLRGYNMGIMSQHALQVIDPKLDGSQGDIFIVLIGQNRADTRAVNTHWGWEASGVSLGRPICPTTGGLGCARPGGFAGNEQAMKDAIRKAVLQVGVPTTTVTLGSPIVGTVREVIPTYTNTAVTADQHIGDVDPATVDADDIREARTTRANHQNNVVFSTSVELPEFKGHFNAHSIYRVTDPKNPRTAREAFFQPIWDAGERLQATSPDSRNILFNKRGQTTLLSFDSANVTAADLGVGIGYLKNIDGVGAKTANDARDMVIGVVRGYRLSTDPLTGTFYRPDGTINFSALGKDGNPTWKLYDAIAAPAVVPNPGRSPDVDPPQNHADGPDGYGVGGSQVGDGFYWDHFNRQTMVYLPTNGGMMHGFDGETGDEVFAYIPDDAMSLDPGEVPGSRDVLSEFVELVVAKTNGTANHEYFLSNSPTIKEAFLRADNTGDDKWHTILAFGRGRGGRFVSVLDITDPLQPTLRFNKGNREGINDGLLDGLGETWSVPVMGNVKTTNPGSDPDRADQWLLFLGGGYGCNNNANEGQYLFALRAEDGSVYFRGQVTNDATASIAYNAVVAMPVLYNPHKEHFADMTDYVTRVYVGDVQGVIWKLVTQKENPSSWSFEKFAELGTNQPITAPVALMRDVNNQQVYVMAGTGGDLRVSATTNTFKFATFVDKDAEGANTTQYPLGSTPFFERTLNAGERVYVAPVTIGRVGDPVVVPVVFFAASKATFDVSTCRDKFFSTLFALGIVSGQAEVDLDSDGAVDASLDLGAGKVTGLYARNENVWVGGLDTGLTSYGDGKFDDPPPTTGGGLTIQMLVDSFRISPF
jgi:hypothetical protein